MLALPIFPGSRPPSIVGADELNFCVRDGNRWTLIAINTNYADGFEPSFILKAEAFNREGIISLTEKSVKGYFW